MESYYGSTVRLEEEKPAKVEKQEESVDNMALAFAFGSPSDNLLDTCSIDTWDADTDEADEQEESEPRFLAPDVARGFVFLPSWYMVYYDLKEDDPERAAQYLERLIDFGVLGQEPPKTSAEDRLIYSLLDGPMNVIDAEFTSYRRKIASERRKKEAAIAKKRAEEAERRKQAKLEWRKSRNGR